jgi:hypothetical protein
VKPTIAIAWPSGEIATPPCRPVTASTPPGKPTSRCTTSRFEAAPPAPPSDSAHPASASAAAATAQGSARPIDVPEGRSPAAAPRFDRSSVTRASPTSRRRVRGSRSRQRSSKSLTEGGVPAGSRLQSGSVLSTAASVSLTVSPTKRRVPVSISKNRTPKAHTSVRRSTGLPRACSGDM